jgi:hypothetical protein
VEFSRYVRRRRTMPVAFALGAAFLLSGCGSKAAPTPSPTASASATMTPTPEGQIQFGSINSHNKFVALGNNIPKNKPFSWIAQFSNEPGSHTVEFQVNVTQGTGAGTLIDSAKIPVQPNASSIEGAYTLAQLKLKKIGPATYEMSYMEGTKTLATGQFTVENCSGTNCSGGGGGY